MRAISTNQTVDILHLNDKPRYVIRYVLELTNYWAIL